MLHQKLRPNPGPITEKTKKKSKSIVKTSKNILQTESSNSNFPVYNGRNSLEDMLEPKVDQLMSVDINVEDEVYEVIMEDEVCEVIMDSDENEEFITRSPEE